MTLEPEKKTRIYLVEDDAIQIFTLKKMLERLGYLIVGLSGDGEEAVRGIIEMKPDIVLLDINLPGELSGIDIGRRIRDEAEYTHIYLTAYNDEEIFRKAIPTNPSGFILKPYNATSLDYQIRIALNTAALAEENAGLYRKLSISHFDLERKVSERTKHLEILNALSRDLNYIMDYRQMFSLLFSHLHGLIRFDIAAGIILDADETSVYTAKTCSIAPAEEESYRRKFAVSAGKAFESAKFIDIDLAGDDPDKKLKEISSVYEVPLYFENELIAHMFFGAEREHAFDADSTRIVDIILNQTAVMIRRLRDLLGSARRRLEEVVRFLPEGIIVLDAEKTLVLRNPKAEKILGVLFGEGIPTSITSLGGLPVEELLSPGVTPVSRVVEVPESDLVFEITAAGMDDGPETGGILIVIKDITEDRKNAVQSALQDRLAAVGKLAAGLAHDINNVLTGIIGYSEYLQIRKDVPEAAMTYLRKIIEQSKRAGHLIQQILDFSRRSVAEHLPLDLVPFCKEMVKLFEHLIPENIEISFRSPEKSLMVNGSPAQIQQILTNLVVNSRDAMPEGGQIKISLVTVNVREDAEPPVPGMTPGDWIVLTVTDTGVGIPRSIIGRVLEPFFTTKEVGKGTGLGLSQVYGLVQQHQGYIDIKSETGKGTSIIIHLPRTSIPESEIEDITELNIPEKSDGSILLVEDEEGILDVISRVLQEVGFTVYTARNGIEALDLYRRPEIRIELVISDVVMPRMGGRELFRELQKINPAVQIVFMTGHPLEDEYQHEEFRNAVAVIQKPLEFAALIQTINTVLNPDYGILNKTAERGSDE